MVKRSLRWKALKLLPGPPIPGYHIEHHDALRIFVINHTLVRCTVSQYAVLALLLQRHGQEVFYEELIRLFDEAALDLPDLFERARRKLIKIMCELREKIEPCGFVIACQSGSGYMLVKCPAFIDDTPPEARSLETYEQSS